MSELISKEILDLGNGTTEKFFLSFAGGGAKGMVHVGVLRYLEERGITVSGVSGTSAGALVAALRAVGYTSQEILDDSGASSLFQDIKRTKACKRLGFEKIQGIENLFNESLRNVANNVAREGSSIKKIVAVLKYFKRPYTDLLLAVLWTALTFLSGLSAAAFTSSFFDGILQGTFAGIAFGILILAGSGYFFARWARRATARALNLIADTAMGGLTDMECFRQIFSEILATKLGRPPQDKVIFSDLPNLSIIATDINTGSPVVFSSLTTPEQSVSDALCASMAFPVIFGMQQVTEFSLYDGGVISNLPTWVFDAESKLYARPKIIAFNIISDDANRAHHVRKLKSGTGAERLYGALSLLGEALMGGSQRLHLRPGGGIREVPIKTKLKTADFDAGPEARKLAVAAGKAAVSSLIEVCRDAPAIYSYACACVRDEAAWVIQSLYEQQNIEMMVDPAKLRVSIALSAPERPDLIQLKFSAGFYTHSTVSGKAIPHSDLGLLLPRGRSVAGRAIEEKRSIFRSISANDHGYLDGDTDHDTICKVAEQTRWVLAVPFANSNEEGRIFQYAISLDGADYLNDLEDALPQEDFQKVVDRFGEAMAERYELIFSDVYENMADMPSMEDCDEAHRL